MKDWDFLKDKICKPHVDVEKFLDETKGNFIDREMIKITEMKNSYYDAAIVNGMFSVCQNFDIHIDEVKLRKWVNMCISLEHISYKEHKDLAINAKIRRLEARVAELEAEKAELKEQLMSFKESWERMLKF